MKYPLEIFLDHFFFGSGGWGVGVGGRGGRETLGLSEKSSNPIPLIKKYKSPKMSVYWVISIQTQVHTYTHSQKFHFHPFTLPHTHIHTHTHTHTHTHIAMHTYPLCHTNAHHTLQSHPHIRTHTHILTITQTSKPTHTQRDTHTVRYTYTHTNTHTHTHTLTIKKRILPECGGIVLWLILHTICCQRCCCRFWGWMMVTSSMQLSVNWMPKLNKSLNKGIFSENWKHH